MEGSKKSLTPGRGGDKARGSSIGRGGVIIAGHVKGGGGITGREGNTAFGRL